MAQYFVDIFQKTSGSGLYDITKKIRNAYETQSLNNGICVVSILHTSASLIIQENADSDVLHDICEFFNKLVPYSKNYRHSFEGKDDMPAHIKSLLTTTSYTLSIKDGKFILGNWQGIFLFEHRLSPRERKVLCHFIGE